MLNKRVLLVATILLGIALLLLGKSYYMESSGWDTLIWNNNEALVIVTRSDWGWRGSYAHEPLWFLEGLLHGHNAPTDKNRCNLMARITPVSMDRIMLPDDFSLRAVCKSEIFAVMKGAFWRWSAGEFIRVPEDEWKRIEPTLAQCPVHQSTHPSDQRDWSSASPIWRRECKDHCDFPLTLGDSTIVLTAILDTNAKGLPLAKRLDLRRGTTVESLSTTVYQNRAVDRRTYEFTFDRHCTAQADRR